MGLDETALPCAVHFPLVFQVNPCALDKISHAQNVGSFIICILLEVDSLLKQHFCKTRVFNNNCIFYFKCSREKCTSLERQSL